MHLAKQPSKPLKQKTVTDFFEPITDKDYQSINESNVLRITIGRLEQGKRLLLQKVENLKQQLSLSKPQEESADLQSENENTRSGKQEKKNKQKQQQQKQQQRKINNSNTYGSRSSSN